MQFFAQILTMSSEMDLPWVLFTSDTYLNIAYTQRPHYYLHTPEIESGWLGLRTHWLCAHLNQTKKKKKKNWLSEPQRVKFK